MRELNDYVGGYAGDFTGEAWQDDEPTDDGVLIMADYDEQPDPAPEPAAPAYDVDAPDSEWDGVPVVSVAMALDVLNSGRSLITQCGPLEVIADDGIVHLWNTETCWMLQHDFETNKAMVDNLHVFGHVAAGDWHVHCPAEPDGAPLY